MVIDFKYFVAICIAFGSTFFLVHETNLIVALVTVLKRTLPHRVNNYDKKTYLFQDSNKMIANHFLPRASAVAIFQCLEKLVISIK